MSRRAASKRFRKPAPHDASFCRARSGTDRLPIGDRRVLPAYNTLDIDTRYQMKTYPEWCPSCQRQTEHQVLFETEWDDVMEEILHSYILMSCRGCGAVLLMDIHRKKATESDPGWVQPHYYPASGSRKLPEWVSRLDDTNENEAQLADLLKEIYAAVAGGQRRLAAMGIRALLEQVMILKVGDIGGFDKKLDGFQDKGFISLVQRDAMRTTLDLGDAAMHRAFAPEWDDLNTALDIAEGVMAAIYGHPPASAKLGDRVPQRKLLLQKKRGS